MRTLVWRWWNGAWGRLARVDVCIWSDESGTRWAIEIREGGTEGRSRWRELPTEQDALAQAQHYRDAKSDRWLDLGPSRHTD